MPYEIDCLVIGAGVVGLAIARQLQLSGREVVLVEKERTFGLETSSRNSEVIHAGIYYPPGSLKARFCVRGRQLLYDYCRDKAIPHKNLGKLIVAVSTDEIPALEKYVQTAEANGVDDLRWLNQPRIHTLEPDIVGVAGLLSPSTGIIDSHAYMQALLHDFEHAGGSFVRNAPVAGGAARREGIELRLADDDGTIFTARSVVNAAGLHAPQVARGMEGMPPSLVPEARFAAGHYFLLTTRSPFSHLVYPIAAAGGLGVHVTLDMANAAKFGPDVSWRKGIDYRFDASRTEDFIQAIRRYYPAIRAGDLAPGYVGIRPKISGPDDPNKDFVIQTEDEHGIAGLINLFGIESPGLTSSLALAEYVENRLRMGASPRSGNR